MKNKKNVIWGLLLILLAAYVVFNRLGLFADIPVVSILLSLIFIYFTINGLIKRNFFEIFIPLALIGCMFDTEIGELTGTNFTSLTPWTLLFAAVLLSIGFNMIFNKKPEFHSDNDPFHGNHSSESTQDGFVEIHTSFDDARRYVNSVDFEQADIHNTFGQSVVYFDNAIMKNGRAIINIKNSFGETIVYIPKTWRAEVTRNASFADVKIIGSGNNDMDAPYVKINASSSFGEIKIYFE